MRFAGSIWPGIALLLLLVVQGSFLSIMVSCGAASCSWDRETDARGLSRHRASCHFYKKSSVLATQKRRERAKEAVFANMAANHKANPSVNVSHVSSDPSCYS
jgi:hypothetical protein